jgi:RNA polymerase sigma-70 factor (ECF subfamily)
MALSEEELYTCYRRLEKPLYNVLFRWLWHAQDCQDLIHDAFLRLWDKRANVDAAHIDNLAWTTALNLARNRLRWRRLWRSADTIDLPNDESDPAEVTNRHQRELKLRAALKSLPTSQRHVVLLSEFGGLTTAEIAHVLGIPPGTVGSRKHLALAQLKKRFPEIDDGYY